MTERLTALDLAPVEPLPDRTAKYLAICEEKLGLVPNVLRVHTVDIAQFDAFAAMYNTLMLGESRLTKLEREMIAVTVSSINRCFYCLTAHGAAVRELSGNPVLGEQLVMNWRTAEVTPQQMAMLRFAAKLTETPDRIEEPDRQALRDAGFGDRDIWDIANVAGFFNMTNRVAAATEMAPNAEYHSQAR
ncbi:peroxidase-related enzyme [Pseudooceanicola sp. 502str34]